MALSVYTINILDSTLPYFEQTGNVFYVVDTETTGFSRSNADAIEISALKVEVTDKGFDVIDTFDTYINPEYPLPEAIVEFNEKNHTGVTDELLAKAPSKAEAARNFVDFIDPSEMKCIVGHNIPFDLKFIEKLLEETGTAEIMRLASLDTLQMSKMHVSGSHKLCDMFELSDKKHTNEANNLIGFHNSLADCYATLDVLDYLKNEFYTKNKEKQAVKRKTNQWER